MPIPTEPIGSIPRPPELIEAVQEFSAGRLSPQKLDALREWAIRDTIRRFEATGSRVITDAEQTKLSREGAFHSGHPEIRWTRSRGARSLSPPRLNGLGLLDPRR